MREDLSDLWWRHKHREQIDLLIRENSALREKLGEFHDSFLIIEAMKKHLLNSKGDFHSILDHFKDVLGIVFSVAEDSLTRRK